MIYLHISCYLNNCNIFPSGVGCRCREARLVHGQCFCLSIIFSCLLFIVVIASLNIPKLMDGWACTICCSLSKGSHLLLQTRNICFFFFAVFLFPLLGTPVMCSFYITERTTIQSFNHNFKKNNSYLSQYFTNHWTFGPHLNSSWANFRVAFQSLKNAALLSLNQTINHNFATNLANLPLVLKKCNVADKLIGIN